MTLLTLFLLALLLRLILASRRITEWQFAFYIVFSVPVFTFLVGRYL